MNMEKFSVEWRNKFRVNLSEKFKYLFISGMHKHFELFDLQVTDVSFNEDTIEGIDVDISLDYHGACGGNASDVGHMLRVITDSIHEFFYNHQIDPKTMKFTNTDVDGLIINDPVILEIDYKLDELHKVILYTTMNYGLK